MILNWLTERSNFVVSSDAFSSIFFNFEMHISYIDINVKLIWCRLCQNLHILWFRRLFIFQHILRNNFCRIIEILILCWTFRILRFSSFNNWISNERIIESLIFVASFVRIFFMILLFLYSSWKFVILIRRIIINNVSCLRYLHVPSSFLVYPFIFWSATKSLQ